MRHIGYPLYTRPRSIKNAVLSGLSKSWPKTGLTSNIGQVPLGKQLLWYLIPSLRHCIGQFNFSSTLFVYFGAVLYQQLYKHGLQNLTAWCETCNIWPWRQYFYTLIKNTTFKEIKPTENILCQEEVWFSIRCPLLVTLFSKKQQQLRTTAKLWFTGKAKFPSPSKSRTPSERKALTTLK